MARESVYCDSVYGAPPVHVAEIGAARTACGKKIGEGWERLGTTKFFDEEAPSSEGGLACRTCKTCEVRRG